MPRLIQTIDFVCAECEWMFTNKFIPTAQWLHALLDIECKYHLLLVYEHGDKLIGWCRIFPDQCEDSVGAGELGIGLLLDYRNKKIGTEMFDSALGWAHNIGMHRVDLSVHKDNQRAIHLFEKFGFKYVSRDGDRFLMCAAL